ncbi:DUF3093 domain-containing protein [Pseudarthrobacter sp. PS3-L1]|uniref:DUF3093 domain-containing protein n=1 Tax=Pseudarthrobacter sp. PS3-L1 TaxID=3046207 RepID=UPI0024BB5B58|nr:DUF3093 domain-containing protein [Pseudarthrobacter sp. PS3-L1]MDJ0320326.1 DUF3093 domain-containing protein [Pseudarthrobacter sp. PS3-L1]
MPDSRSSAPSPANNVSPATPVYREKLWPALWIWVVVAGISGAGILVFAPISFGAGLTAAAVLFVIMAVLLILSTPLIEVTDRTFTVGRATIERQFIGEVAAFRDGEATAERGVRLNAVAYLCIRGWVSPVVRATITDPSDSTPYWLTSSRHPEDLVAALTTRPE